MPLEQAFYEKNLTDRRKIDYAIKGVGHIANTTHISPTTSVTLSSYILTRYNGRQADDEGRPRQGC